MTYHPVVFGIGFVVGLLIYISYYCWHIKSYENWEPTREEIANEIKLMQLEKEHFGHSVPYYDRHTREYKKWLESLK
jgi:hypothetical protein